MESQAQTSPSDTLTILMNFVPNLVGAVILLVVGWLVSLFLSRLVETLLRNSQLSVKIADAVADEDAAEPHRVEYWAGRSVFLLLMLFVLVGFFQVLGVTQITEPILRFLNEIFEYAPRLIGPALLVLIAWLLAKFLRIAVRRGLRASRLDERLDRQAEIDSARRVSMSDTLADAVYWLTLLLFLPAVLSALDLGGLLEPVREVVRELLGYLPNLLAAAVILLVGWFVARVLRRLVANTLASAGADRLGSDVGLSSVTGKQPVSEVAGLIVYVLVFLPVLIAALNALDIDAVTDPISAMLSKSLAAIPNVFAGALVLIVAYIVGRIVAGLVARVLSGIGFDALPQRIGFSAEMVSGSRTLSDVAGSLVLIAIMLFATIEALELIGFSAFAELIADFLVFASRILFGIAIIAIGILLGRIAGQFVRSANPPQAGLLAGIAQTAIVVLSFAVGLEQMGIGEEIIALAFGLSLGAIAIAAAIAFGLGGRDAAGEAIKRWRQDLPKE